MPAKNEKKGTSEKKTKVVDGDLRFFVSNGETLTSLEELSQKIKTFDEATLSHHISNGRNDFADWVENVFKQKTLANKLRKSKTREELNEALE